MIDRSVSGKVQDPVYKRVDSIRGAWGALFIAAGLAEPNESSSPSTRKYKKAKKFGLTIVCLIHDTICEEGLTSQRRKRGCLWMKEPQFLGMVVK